MLELIILAALQEVAWPQELPRHAAELGRRLNEMRAALAEVGILVRAERQNGGTRQRRWIVERAGAEGVALH